MFLFALVALSLAAWDIPYCIDYATDEKNEQTCNICSTGYLLNNGSCVVPTPNMCKKMNDAGNKDDFSKPSDCASGYITGWMNGSVLMPLMDGCLRGGEDTCTECVQGYMLVHDQCVKCDADPNCASGIACEDCQKCRIGRLTVNNTCKVDTNCATWTSGKDRCTTCIWGYYWDADKMACVEGSIANCLVYATGTVTDDKDTCTECLYPYVPSQDKSHCVEQNVYGKCTDDECIACRGNVCTECNGLHNAYLNKKTGNCDIVPYPCVKAEYDTNYDKFFCKQCDHGYYLADGYTCERCNRGEHCVKCGNKDGYPGYHECLECEDGYFVNDDHGCSPNPPHCLVYNNQRHKCDACETNYTVMDNGECGFCRVEHCNQCTCERKCQGGYCEEGYRLDNFFQCEQCQVDNCVNCNSDVTKCDTCADGYKYEEVDGKSKCTYNPIEHCKTYSSPQVCQTCETGYYLESDNSCSPQNVENCRPGSFSYKSNENYCYTCDEDYYSYNGVCMSCQDVVTNESFTKSYTNMCSQCKMSYPTYVPDYIPYYCHKNHCTKFETMEMSACKVCEHGYKLDENKQCVPLVENCRMWNTNTYNGEEKDLCVECKIGSYMKDDGTCGKCNDECYYCFDQPDNCVISFANLDVDDVYNKSKLYQCEKSGYVFEPRKSNYRTDRTDVHCHQCDKAGFDPIYTRCPAVSCKQYDDLGRCRWCQTSYMTSSGPRKIKYFKSNSNFDCVYQPNLHIPEAYNSEDDE